MAVYQKMRDPKGKLLEIKNQDMEKQNNSNQGIQQKLKDLDDQLGKQEIYF